MKLVVACGARSLSAIRCLLIFRAGAEMNYRTRPTLFGLPLVHIAIGRIEQGCYKRGVARGWIAIGDISFGVIVSLGGLAVGGIAIGGLALGVLSLAGLALGVYALGGGAIGVAACGGGALAWEAALGGLAVARSYAEGGLAIAKHANDPAASDFFKHSSFFSWAGWLLKHSRWLLLFALLPVIQGVLRWLTQRRQGPDI